MFKRLKFCIFKWYYQKHPEKFIEKYYNIALLEYQKKIIKEMIK